MKKQIAIELIIWLIILSILSGIGVFIYHKFFVEPNVHVIQFKDIDGITKGSPVRFMGINIGYVRNLKSKDKHINVQIIVTKKNFEIPEGQRRQHYDDRIRFPAPDNDRRRRLRANPPYGNRQGNDLHLLRRRRNEYDFGACHCEKIDAFPEERAHFRRYGRKRNLRLYDRR
jgi:hypothetical protein